MVTAATALPDQSQPVGVSERSGQKPVCGGHAALAWLFSIALESPLSCVLRELCAPAGILAAEGECTVSLFLLPRAFVFS